MKRGIVIILFLSVLIISFGSYFFVKYDFEKVKEIKVTRDDYNKSIDFEYEIEDIAYSEKDVIITGWVAQINNNNKYINRSLFIKSNTLISVFLFSINSWPVDFSSTFCFMFNKLLFLFNIGFSTLIVISPFI